MGVLNDIAKELFNKDFNDLDGIDKYVVTQEAGKRGEFEKWK